MKAALALQQKEGGGRNIGEILVEMGVCDYEDIKNCAQVQEKMRNGGIKHIIQEIEDLAEEMHNFSPDTID